MSYRLPQILENDVERKFGNVDLSNADMCREVALYVHHLTTVILEGVRPAKGHGARKKRVYAAVEQRMRGLRISWIKQAGFDLTDKEPVIGAWEIATGDNNGLFAEQFAAQPEALKPLLMRIGAAMVVPFGETQALLVRAQADWTLMDVWDEASKACYDQVMG